MYQAAVESWPAERTSVRRPPSRTVILAVARRLLRDRSYEQFCLGEVAEQAGLSRRTIYNQFVDKDDLYRTSREALFAEVGGMIPARIDGGLPLAMGLKGFALEVTKALSSEGYADLTGSLIRDGRVHGWLDENYERFVTEPIRQAIEIFLYAKRDEGSFECSNVQDAAALFMHLLQSVAAPRTIVGRSSVASFPNDIQIEAIVRSFLIQHGIG